VIVLLLLLLLLRVTINNSSIWSPVFSVLNHDNTTVTMTATTRPVVVSSVKWATSRWPQNVLSFSKLSEQLRAHWPSNGEHTQRPMID
jgi:hypothetical protein